MVARTCLSKVIAAIAIMSGLVGVPSAQTPSAPTFEVASVKVNKSRDASIGIYPRGTEFRATNIPLRVLIGQAYGIRQDSELVGGPAWLDTDRFDIVAKVERPGSPVLAMVRTLLADRFKLVTHQEMKALPIYVLAVVRSDGQLGPKLRPSACTAGRKPENAAEQRCTFRPGPGVFVGSGVSLSTLIAASLSPVVQRTIVDRTGLTGTFDIDLHWTPDNLQLGLQPETAPPGDPDGPSIFTALPEQLGLKLEPTKGPVDVLVIDHVEHPTED